MTVRNTALCNLPTEAVFREAAEAAFAAAVPYEYNGFKIALGQDTLVRVLNELVHPGAGSGAPVTSAGESAMTSKSIIGAGIDRVDGPLKVTGGYSMPGISGSPAWSTRCLC